MDIKLDRRKFINVLSLAGTGLAIGIPSIAKSSVQNEKPALLGGPKAHPGGFSDWPIFDETEEAALEEVLKSKSWGRLNGDVVRTFEKEYGKTLRDKCFVYHPWRNGYWTG